jgi:dihydroorotate dehydrogenase (NAD+) catalytic subunit
MLPISLAGAKLQNPTVLASGILGTTGASLIRVAKEGAGAVTTKSISLKARKGHPTPIITTFDAGMLNAVGLSNPGIEESLLELDKAVEGAGVPVIASLVASKVEEFGELAKLISKGRPSIIELNISCPNVSDEFGRPFACAASSASEVVAEVKRNTKLPVFVKLSPNVLDIGAIAASVEKAGADGITAINTVGPGMQINIDAAMPVLTNKVGGVSGPAIKPVAVRCVYDIYKATKLPIIGTGGVTNARDAIEMIMAGATAVGVGTAVYYRGVKVFSEIPEGMREFMEKEGYSKIEEIRGIAHEK